MQKSAHNEGMETLALLCFAAQAVVCPTYADVEDFLQSYDLVEEYCYTVSGDNIAVGLITQPIFTLSAITRYTRDLENALKQKFGFADAVVTFDTDLIYRIKKTGNCGDAETVKQIMQTARNRR